MERRVTEAGHVHTRRMSWCGSVPQASLALACSPAAVDRSTGQRRTAPWPPFKRPSNRLKSAARPVLGKRERSSGRWTPAVRALRNRRRRTRWLPMRDTTVALRSALVSPAVVHGTPKARPTPPSSWTLNLGRHRRHRSVWLATSGHRAAESRPGSPFTWWAPLAVARADVPAYRPVHRCARRDARLGGARMASGRTRAIGQTASACYCTPSFLCRCAANGHTCRAPSSCRARPKIPTTPAANHSSFFRNGTCGSCGSI